MSWGGGKVIVNTDKREMEESRERKSERGKEEDIVVIQEKVLFRINWNLIQLHNYLLSTTVTKDFASKLLITFKC